VWPQTKDFKDVGQQPFVWAAQELRVDQLRKEKIGVRVMTDLDDTLFCSGGGRISGGIDAVCAGTTKHGLYPKVAEFYYSLSLGFRADVTWGVTSAPGAIPFSARPSPLVAAAEAVGRNFGVGHCGPKDFMVRERVCGCPSEVACKSRERNPKCSCFGIATELAHYGRLGNMTDVWNDDFTDMGYTKFNNWAMSQSRSKFDSPMVFVGDNGQGDLLAAQMMLAASFELPDSWCGQVIAAFIHDVADACDEGCKDAWAEQNIFIFSNYTEATQKAKQIRLLPERIGTGS